MKRREDDIATGKRNKKMIGEGGIDNWERTEFSTLFSGIMVHL